MAKIIIPTPLRKFTQGLASFESTQQTVKTAINDLVTQFPDLKNNILDQTGTIRSFMRVYVGDEDMNELDGDATSLENNSVISIVPAIAGGKTN